MDVNTRTTSEMIMVMRAVKNDSVKLNSNQLLDQITRGLVRTIVGFAIIGHRRSTRCVRVSVELNRIMIDSVA